MEKQAFRLIEFAANYLKANPGRKFTSRELSEGVIQANPEAAKYKMATSSRNLDQRRLKLQVQAQIGASWRGIMRKSEHITVTTERPMRFFWSEDNVRSQDENFDSDSQYSNDANDEAQLYPILREYLANSKSVYSMRIDEKRSSSRGGAGRGHWLHPDLVGIQLLSEDWGKQSQQLAKFYNTDLIKVWSFEVKVRLSISNVRSSFFQAVSNSSWANFGYLVAETIDVRALEELEILASDHGIGVLQLNTNAIEESTVLIPAKERSSLSWNSINRLAEENKDFADFLMGLERLHQTQDVKLVGNQFETSFKTISEEKVSSKTRSKNRKTVSPNDQ
jgi:uncharacterized protein